MTSPRALLLVGELDQHARGLGPSAIMFISPARQGRQIADVVCDRELVKAPLIALIYFCCALKQLHV